MNKITNAHPVLFINEKHYQSNGQRPGSFIRSITFMTIFLFLCMFQLKAQDFPPGFSQQLVAGNIASPTVMKFAPDGRIFVAQQTGQLRIIKNGALLAQPFISLTVDAGGERGLLGIAFDPQFTSNHYIYLYYTVAGGANNRISRFTANGDVVVPGSEVVVLNLDPLSSATNHNGGTMEFGPDGKLYVGIGENGNGANAQNTNTYLGKVLRINSDGSVPSGNPFTTGSAQQMRIWEYGLRNPYTLTFQPGTGKLFVNDVGQTAWEEINNCTNGGLNYGWPNAEGNSTNTAYTNPVYAYAHGSVTGQGCAITGGTFFNPSSSNYPATYNGNYFFLDYCGNWIDRLVISGTNVTRVNFATNIAGFPLGLITGPDGNLYYCSRGNSSVVKVVYSGPPSTVTLNPVADAYVKGGSNSGVNYGTEPRLYTKKDDPTSDLFATSYLRFNIANISLPVTDAKLKLYGSLFQPGATTMVVNVFSVADQSWQETTINYNNKPAAGTNALASKTVSTTEKYYVWDLTSFINSARTAGNTLVSILVRNHTSGDNSRVKFNSKEADAHPPKLVVTSGSGLFVSVMDQTERNAGITSDIDLNIYPNPASNFTRLSITNYNSDAELHAMIYSITGQLVRDYLITDHTDQNIPLEGIERGTYILSLRNDKEIRSQKLVIE